MIIDDILTRIVPLESDEQVDDFLATGGRVLYFTADWCRPCKIYGPRITQAANTLNVIVGKVNADFAPNTLRRYNLKSVPTLIKTNHLGEILQLETGVRDVEFVKSFIQ